MSTTSPVSPRRGACIVGVPASRSHPDFEPVMEAIRAAAAKRATREGRALRDRRNRTAAQRRGVDWRGRPLQASYVNFYLANGGVVMPAFDDPQRRTRARCARRLFSGPRHPADRCARHRRGRRRHSLHHATGAGMRNVTLAATQFACSWDRARQYRQGERHWCATRRRKGANVVLLQELFETPYFCQDQSAEHFALAEAVRRQSADRGNGGRSPSRLASCCRSAFSSARGTRISIRSR